MDILSTACASQEASHRPHRQREVALVSRALLRDANQVLQTSRRALPNQVPQAAAGAVQGKQPTRRLQAQPLQLIPEEGESSESNEDTQDARVKLFSMEASEDECSASVFTPQGPVPQPEGRTEHASALAAGQMRTVKPGHFKQEGFHAKLANLAERRVLSAAVRSLHQDLLQSRSVNLLELPRRPDGSSRVMQVSFLTRLLSGTEIKNCMESDISAAYLDLRHLTLEQLLSIKMANLDFVTASASHSAHNNFLEAVEAYLSEQLLQRALACCDHVGRQLRAALGRRLLMIMGACALLREGWGSFQGTFPAYWAVELDSKVWQGASVAIFQPKQLKVQLFSQPDEAALGASGSMVAVVKDTSSGIAPSRRLQWEVTAVDPSTCDVTAAVTQNAALLQKELEKVLSAKRHQTGQIPDAIREIPRPLRSRVFPLPGVCLLQESSGRKSWGHAAARGSGRVKQSIERIDKRSRQGIERCLD
ncbi:unnamed protein product [Durusdinium trenchii]|uniref:Uncharacterized protein n=1 Tax=Durusdinium trenchii TaxID=1381693 RepID=A0ABP0RRX2_9DINO